MNYEKAFLRQLYGPTVLILAIWLVFACGLACAQDGESPDMPAGTANGSSTANSAQPSAASAVNSANPTAVAANTLDTDTSQAQASDVPSAINIETGLPLRSLSSPLRWGHLSIMSATLVGAYDGNYLQNLTPQGAQLTFVNGLIVYGLRRRRTTFDIQYMPTVWAAQGRIQNDFANQALNAFTSFGLSRNWSISIQDV